MIVCSCVPVTDFHQFINASIVSYCLFFDLGGLAGPNLGEVVGPQHTDGVDDNGEGYHQLDGGGDELASLQGRTAHDHNGLGDTLATQRGNQGSHDALRQGREETGNNSAQVECRGQYYDVASVQHLSLYCFLHYFSSIPLLGVVLFPFVRPFIIYSMY